MTTLLHSLKYEDSEDQKVFTALFDGYYVRLCWFAQGFVTDSAASEDIVQDCFVKIWNRRGERSLRDLSPSYLYMTVRHRCQNYLRDRRVSSADPEHLETASDLTVLNRIIESETYYELFLALDILPPKCREVFKMLYMDGKEAGEIARELNISASTVRNQKAKGLALLRQVLRPVVLVILVCFR